PAGEFRDGQHLVGPVHRRTDDQLVIEALERRAVVRHIDVVEVVDGEHEGQPAAGRRNVTGAVERLGSTAGEPAAQAYRGGEGRRVAGAVEQPGEIQTVLHFRGKAADPMGADPPGIKSYVRVFHVVSE